MFCLPYEQCTIIKSHLTSNAKQKSEKISNKSK